MKTIVLRLTILLAVALFAVSVTAQDEVLNADFNIGPAGGANSCAMCMGMTQGGTSGGGYSTIYCTSPESGGWGFQYCSVETYPEASYCLNYGDDCCVD